MIDLCQYKDIFGKPNEGAHSYRFLGIAIVDLFLTLLVAYYVAYKYKKSFIEISVVFIIIGVIAHSLFCVDTTFNRFLGLAK